MPSFRRGRFAMSYHQLMRYRSLISVDFILIDGRVDSHVLRTVINQSLMALSDHLPCHIVVLCATRKRAEEIDLFGEQCGHELFFHAENADTNEEFQSLVDASKLFVIPIASCHPKLSTYKDYSGDTPFLLAAPDYTYFYPDGASSECFVEMPLLSCFLSLFK